MQELSADGRKAFFLMRREAPEAYLQQFRQLRSRLFRFQETLGRQRVDCRSLLVTSPSAGEGKSFVASNLALMMAVAPQCRILLADCNVHRPSFPERFHLREGAGLRNALAGAPWQSVSRRLKGTNLFVTGLGTQTSSSQEPLDYNKLKSWMDDVKKDFQWIILDGTSLEESPDAEMLSYATDRTLLVVRKGQTRFEEMDRCLSKIDDSLLAGVVFNQ
ncbi:MAG: CpsD/CapB family tyrosine-protein kinase [Acidobacteria bacterium]|nr:CpsD/CapB family tyrosine-protein kinase [Acidobacteriota bacterium]